ncbi:MAG: transposase [Wolbachia sp.]|nr:transposase [Wolbachia sp.]MDD9336132.1 transposase [Wolbachia sp.]
MDYKHSSHSTFNLKYHLVFCTKYRLSTDYRTLTGQTTVRSKEIITEVCTANYVDIVVAAPLARGYFAVTVDNMNSTDVQKYIEEQGNPHNYSNDFNIEF